MKGKPLWRSACIDSCSLIDFPLNNTYVYSENENTCIKCPDNSYTIDNIKCLPQPYPMKITNYDNNYLIIEFSNPVKYSQATLKEIFSVSVGGNINQNYEISWEIPFWESGQYQQNVFIELNIFNTLDGSEILYLYINSVFITDRQGYQLLSRNSTSNEQYLPMRVQLANKDYISARDKFLIQSFGNSVLISMLITIGVNAAISILSVGSMELMYTFLNVV